MLRRRNFPPVNSRASLRDNFGQRTPCQKGTCSTCHCRRERQGFTPSTNPFFFLQIRAAIKAEGRMSTAQLGAVRSDVLVRKYTPA